MVTGHEIIYRIRPNKRIVRLQKYEKSVRLKNSIFFFLTFRTDNDDHARYRM